MLARGYALVRDADGLPVRSAEAAAEAARLQLQFADGAVFVRPEGAPTDPAAAPLAAPPADAPTPPRPKRAPRRAAPEPAAKATEGPTEPAARQGSLF